MNLVSEKEIYAYWNLAAADTKSTLVQDVTAFARALEELVLTRAPVAVEVVSKMKNKEGDYVPYGEITTCPHCLRTIHMVRE